MLFFCKTYVEDLSTRFGNVIYDYCVLFLFALKSRLRLFPADSNPPYCNARVRQKADFVGVESQLVVKYYSQLSTKC